MIHYLNTRLFFLLTIFFVYKAPRLDIPEQGLLNSGLPPSSFSDGSPGALVAAL